MWQIEWITRRSGYGIVLCLLLLIGLYRQVKLSEAESAAMLETMREEVVALRSELSSLRRRSASAAPAGAQELFADDQAWLAENRNYQKKLKSGVYTLLANVTLDRTFGEGSYKSEVTIHHIKTRLSQKGYAIDLNIGIATSGVASVPELYIDCDSDGKVDPEIMRDIIGLLPMGGLLGRAIINEQHAQEYYSTFLRNTKKATYSPATEMQSGTLIADLWSSIQKQSDLILNASKTSGNKKELETFASDVGARF